MPKRGKRKKSACHRDRLVIEEGKVGQGELRLVDTGKKFSVGKL